MTTLSILSLSDDELDECLTLICESIKTKGQYHSRLIEDSPCLLINDQKGSISMNGRRHCAYHVVAWKKLGRDRLELVPPHKSSKESFVVSHLCGTSFCCNDEHIVIEPKWVNDERTHCHFTMTNVFESNRYDYKGNHFNNLLPILLIKINHIALKKLAKLKHCNHAPLCGTRDSSSFSFVLCRVIFNKIM